MKFTNQLFILLLALVCSVNLFTQAQAQAQAQTQAQTQTLGKASTQNTTQVATLKITTLSTMLASRGIGEWGYAALVEADNKRILFDTGSNIDTVLKNAKTLNIDLSTIEDVVISHNHGDHTGGLLTLRKTLMKINPKALSRIHVGAGIFAERINYNNRMRAMKQEIEATGVKFIIHKQTTEIAPGVWVTGPVKRIHPEKNWGGKGKIKTANGPIEDIIAEDQSLVINSKKGFVLVSGCGHAGIINTMEHINNTILQGDIYAAIGGFHLVSASDEHLKWTAEKLNQFGTKNIIGAHCTGINSLFILKDLMSLTRRQAVVGSIGDSFDLVNGIKASYIAR